MKLFFLMNKPRSFSLLTLLLFVTVNSYEVLGQQVEAANKNEAENHAHRGLEPKPGRGWKKDDFKGKKKDVDGSSSPTTSLPPTAPPSASSSPSEAPSNMPSSIPSTAPSVSSVPSTAPSASLVPSAAPSDSSSPSSSPSSKPSSVPSTAPSASSSPSSAPSSLPSYTPIGTCELGVNYAFAGVPLQISGDPHTKLVNGGRHDFQGQPTVTFEGNTLNQFYYQTQCSDVAPGELPYRLLGTHYHWGNRPVTGIDYMTIELLGPRDEVLYYLYFSGEIAHYGRPEDGATSNYDESVASSSSPLISFTSHVSTVLGSPDRPFTVDYSYAAGASPSITVQLTFPDGEKVYMYMKAQQLRVTDAYTGATRYRMHYVYVKTDDLFKCYLCGLAGDYRNSIASTFQGCDGQIITAQQGTNIDVTPQAYDIFGLSYEKNYWSQPNCDTTNYGDGTLSVDDLDTRRRDQRALLRGSTSSSTENSGGDTRVLSSSSSLSSPCDESDEYLQLVQEACARQIDYHAACCRDTGEDGLADTCTFLEDTCQADVCNFSMTSNDEAGGYTVDGSIAVLVEQLARDTLGETLDGVCNDLPNLLNY